jgi:mycofactocin precursor
MEQEIREMEMEVKDKALEAPFILQEIVIEELAVDGICGIY